MNRALRTALLTLLVAGCNTTPARPPVTTPAQHCNYHELPNGQRVCILDQPLTGATAARARAEGLRVEALVDPMFEGPLEPSVDLRSDFGLDGCLQVRNQDECGWCVAQAVGAALDGLYCAEGCPPPRVSMAHLWDHGHGGTISATDCSDGWQIAPALDAASNGTPLIGEDEWAYSGTPRSMDASRPDAATLGMGRYGATGYGTLTLTNDDAQLESMKRTLASGRVLVVSSGICWDHGWQAGTGLIDTPPMNCAQDGMSAYDGYHAYTIVGYDDTTMEFIALNSWGQGWGNDGYMRLSYDYARTQLNDVGYLNQMDSSHGACEMGEDPPDTLAERCAAITTCDQCGSTSGCVFCDGACVAADADRNGPATGTCTALARTATDCPAPSTACSAHTDCGSCAGDSACAWCSGRSACVAWPSEYGACASGGRIATAADECNGALGACEMQMDCGSCAALDGCGYCPTASATLHSGAMTHCFGGNAAGPDRVVCPMGDWTPPGGMCPAEDAGVPDAGGADAGMGGSDGGTSDAGGDPCTAGTDCGSCNEISGCGWCVGTSTCMHDLERSARCGGGDWDDSPAECYDCTALYGSDCATCMFDGNCGWCDASGTCQTATSMGGRPATCGSGWHYIDDGTVCE